MSYPAFDEIKISIARQVLQDLADVDFGASVRRSIVVGQIEMGDPRIERGVNHFPLVLGRRITTKIMPKAQCDFGQQQARSTTSSISHAAVITIFIRSVVAHRFLNIKCSVIPKPFYSNVHFPRFGGIGNQPNLSAIVELTPSLTDRQQTPAPDLRDHTRFAGSVAVLSQMPVLVGRCGLSCHPANHIRNTTLPDQDIVPVGVEPVLDLCCADT